MGGFSISTISAPSQSPFTGLLAHFFSVGVSRPCPDRVVRVTFELQMSTVLNTVQETHRTTGIDMIDPPEGGEDLPICRILAPTRGCRYRVQLGGEFESYSS